MQHVMISAATSAGFLPIVLNIEAASMLIHTRRASTV